jgi:hypothetical protein
MNLLSFNTDELLEFIHYDVSRAIIPMKGIMLLKINVSLPTRIACDKFLLKELVQAGVDLITYLPSCYQDPEIYLSTVDGKASQRLCVYMSIKSIKQRSMTASGCCTHASRCPSISSPKQDQPIGNELFPQNLLTRSTSLARHADATFDVESQEGSQISIAISVPLITDRHLATHKTSTIIDVTSLLDSIVDESHQRWDIH